MSFRGTSLKVIAGTAIVGFLIWFVGWEDVVRAMFRIKAWDLVLVALAYVFILFLTGLSLWFYFPGIPALRMEKIGLLSWSLGMITPAKLGHLSIFYFLKKEGIGYVKCGAALMIDRSLGYIVTLCFFIGGLMIFFPETPVAYYILLSAVGVAAATFALFHSKGRALLQRAAGKRLGLHVEGFATELKKTLRSKRQAMAFSVGSKILVALVSSWTYIVLFRSLGFDAPFWMVLFVFSASSFINLIPVTMDGLGLRESVAILLYNQAGINPSAVVTAHLVVRLFNYAFAGALFALFWEEAKGMRHELPRLFRKGVHGADPKRSGQ